jgi:hypothetical protein
LLDSGRIITAESTTGGRHAQVITVR